MCFLQYFLTCLRIVQESKTNKLIDTDTDATSHPIFHFSPKCSEQLQCVVFVVNIVVACFFFCCRLFGKLSTLVVFKCSLFIHN